MHKNFTSLDFRQTMGKFATGVTIVTTPKGDGVHGMTANAFMSVSLEPPLVLISVDKRANTHRFIRETKCFGINILRDGQTDISNHFAGKPDPKVGQAMTYDRLADVPVLSDCLANIACRLWAKYDGGDHSLFVGEVLALQEKGTEDNPLLFFQGTYRKIGS